MKNKTIHPGRRTDRQAGRHTCTHKEILFHIHICMCFDLQMIPFGFSKKIGSTAETAAGRGSEHGVCELGHIPTQASAATTISGGEFCIQAHELPPTLATTSLTTHPLTHSPLHTFDFFIWNWDLVVVCCSGIDIQIATKKLHLL